MIFFTLKLVRKAITAFCLVAGGALLVDGGWIYAKAQLAQELIKEAWNETLETGAITKPWPWADTWPVARLESEQHGVDLYILQGTHGSSLAFGPGHLTGSAMPGEEGSTVIAGHRDTHFQFLKELKQGDHLKLTNTAGEQQRYLVNALYVVDSSQHELMTSESQDQLILVTCYPFNAIDPGGPLRYVVYASQQEPRLVM